MKKIALLLLSIIVLGCNSKTDNKTESVKKEPDQKIISEIEESKIDPAFYVEVPDEFLGVYLPVLYIDELNHTKNHSLAMHSNTTSYHNLLIVQKNIIYSNLKWHDGYAIKKSENEKYQYITEAADKIIVDDNGNTYRRISTDTENSYNIIDEYVLNIIFKELIIHNKIEIKENKVVMFGKEFEISLDDMFFPRNLNLILYNREDKTIIALKIINNLYYFYKIIQGNEGPESILSDEVVYQISID